MATKVVRGQLMTFIATPKDYLNASVTPASVTLYIDYVHADETTSTDTVAMVNQMDGTWQAEFDTAVAEPGALFVSLRSVNPSAAEDIKYSLVANAANPDP